MPFANSDGTRIYWRLQGARDRPVLMLLNSIGADQSMYDRVALDLIGDFRLLRVDTRGHGASDAPAGDYSLDVLADDLLAVLDAAEVRSAIVCGLSLGGMMAMTLALKAPERVRALLLACTSAAMDRGFWQERIDTVRAHGLGAVADLSLARLFSEPFARANPEFVDTIRAGLLTGSADGYSGCAAAIRDMKLLDQLPTIAAPTLVLAGAQDLATPYEGHGDRIAAAIPHACALVLSTGHLACIEDPGAFAAAIRESATAVTSP